MKIIENILRKSLKVLQSASWGLGSVRPVLESVRLRSWLFRSEQNSELSSVILGWEDNENICSVPGNIYTKCVVGSKYKSCKVFPADHICGYWENLACVFMLETGTFNSEYRNTIFLHCKIAPKPVFIEASDGDEELGFSLRLRVPTWWVVPTRTEWVRWPSKIFQHRNSVLPRQFLADQNGGCDSRGHCDIFMKKYLKRAKYFSEKSLENFEIFADVHPKYSWNLTGKKISAEFSRFYKDNSTARFSKYKWFY